MTRDMHHTSQGLWWGGGCKIHFCVIYQFNNFAATEFAKQMGFPEESLQTYHSKEEWENWKQNDCQPNFRQVKKRQTNEALIHQSCRPIPSSALVCHANGRRVVCAAWLAIGASFGTKMSGN